MLKKLVSLPAIILVMLVGVGCFGDYIDISTKAHLLAVSLLLKGIIVFVLPFLIFSFVLYGLMSLKNESVKMVLILVPLVCISNFSGFWISYVVAVPILKTGIVTVSNFDVSDAIIPAWQIGITPIIKNDIALLAGVITGFIGNFTKSAFIDMAKTKLNVIANFVLKRMICPVLPLFVLGFIIKMQHEGTLGLMIREYAILLGLVGALAYGYMFFVMFILSRRSLRSALIKFRNLLPGVLIGLFCMSSAAAIPTTIEGSEKNLDNPAIAKFVVPATANMHLLGDCFAIPIIGLALIVSFGQALPTVDQYLIFTLYGVVAKFAAAGIPGGSALVFLPIFENVFGFSAPMLTAVVAVYVLFDPIATSANVFGHGMFAILFEKVYNRIIRKVT
ncbi:MAG: dicarboxylate/amino acid:cation symporter [Holosporales bacterium]|jgi:Na+/H+-dicarboxylate symporter|nr:dicarboxylate/amino acid:cation symporter [Holosporales bacterium]